MKWAVIGLITVAVLAAAVFFLFRYVEKRARVAESIRVGAEVECERADVLEEMRDLTDEEALERWKNEHSGESP